MASRNPRHQRFRRHGRKRGHRRLFWRVYLHGVMLLVLATIAIGLVGRTVGPPGPYHGMVDRFGRWIAGSAAKDPAQLQRELDRVHQQLGLRISVYRRDGRLVATSVRPPLAPLDPRKLSGIKPGETSWVAGRFVVGIPHDRQHGGYVLLDAPHHGAFAGKALAALAAVLLVLALGSVPLVRWIVGPLERLTATARQLGGGDLSARSGISRHDEVGQLARAFDEMAGRLDQLLTGERQLLANISHELRTPLARIRVALELAAEDDEGPAAGNPPEGGRYLREIGADLAELETLIEDVLTVARLDLIAGGSDRAMLRLEPLSGAELVERAAGRFGERHPERPLSLERAEDLPTVQADPRLLPRVIDNLLENAHKYSEPERPVTLAARTGAGGTLLVEVRDEGAGIPAEDLRRLFEPFFRGDRSRTRDSGGIGLGLALAKRIVEAHGGAIDAESTVGEGTTVRFRVPAAGGATDGDADHD